MGFVTLEPPSRGPHRTRRPAQRCPSGAVVHGGLGDGRDPWPLVALVVHCVGCPGRQGGRGSIALASVGHKHVHRQVCHPEEARFQLMTSYPEITVAVKLLRTHLVEREQQGNEAPHRTRCRQVGGWEGPHGARVGSGARVLTQTLPAPWTLASPVAKEGPGLHGRCQGDMWVPASHRGSGASSLRPPRESHSVEPRGLGAGLTACVLRKPLGEF